MIPHFVGCGIYYRALEKSANRIADGLMAAQKELNAASEHRKKCPECIRLNRQENPPLEVGLWGENVQVTDV